MPLSPGTHLGPYDVLAALGAGGMGEVYRARDTKLNRDVALKVLPDAFAQDAERMARFQREAHVLASLNHPNIAAIHGLEDSGETHALVLELVEGPTLADRIAQGPIPVDEALPIAKQIAEALEAAHEQGIIHRDLKPANIKLRPDGTVKVLDFGLAKALEGEQAQADQANSPTLSMTAAATRAGFILGTAAYMSPEQARGKLVDKRTDIWAFGAVLFEMLSRRQVFKGEDISLTLAEVMQTDPDLTQLPVDSPPVLVRLIRHCLVKEPKNRIRDAGDARLVLDGAFDGLTADEGSSTQVRAPVWRRPVPLWGAALGLVVAGFAGLLTRDAERAPAVGLRQFTVALPGEYRRSFREGVAALSRDGQTVVLAVTVEGKNYIYRRRFSESAGQLVPDTEGAAGPTLSPDGEWVAYRRGPERDIVKSRLDGGSPVRLVVAAASRELSWGPTDFIAYSLVGGGLYQVPASGGDPEPLTVVNADRGERQHRHPQYTPDGRAVVFTVEYSDGTPSQIALRHLATGKRQALAQGEFARIASGYLVFSRDRAVFAQPLDAGVWQVEGDPHLTTFGPTDRFALSGNGVMVFHPPGGEASRLAWFDRAGRHMGAVSEEHVLRTFDYSPRSGQLVASRRELGIGDTGNLWLFDLARLTWSRVTSGPQRDVDPRWSPAGDEIIFGSTRDPRRSPFRVAANGGALRQVFQYEGRFFSLDDWSEDGRFLLHHEGATLLARSLDQVDDRRVVFEGLDGRIDQASFSPDGRWIAYNANETGRMEVYVVPFPRTGERWLVSTDGGVQPVWGVDGTTLYYLTQEGTMMAVDVGTNGSLTLGQPQALFDTPIAAPEDGIEQYAVGRGDEQFLILEPSAAEIGYTVVLDWFQELNAQVPAVQ